MYVCVYKCLQYCTVVSNDPLCCVPLCSPMPGPSQKKQRLEDSEEDDGSDVVVLPDSPVASKYSHLQEKAAECVEKHLCLCSVCFTVFAGCLELGLTCWCL